LIVWFDPWKYENEKYLAAIPFIRTIQIEVENKVIKLLKESRDDGIVDRWNELRKRFLKALNGFIESSNLNLAMAGYGSVGVDLAKFRDILQSDRKPIKIDNETIYYHDTHLSDYLVDALSKLKESKTNRGNEPRIVVFIDDLDRCAPDRALEVLESLKTFFDIEGFVYVVGMNSESINSSQRKVWRRFWERIRIHAKNCPASISNSNLDRRLEGRRNS
jgi:predicted KAP-like P-loop ATPase